MIVLSQETVNKCTREILKILQANTNNAAEAQAILERISVNEYSVISLDYLKSAQN